MSVTIFLDDDEITGEAYSVSVSRGRALEGDVFNPGGGTVRVRNYEANFNPYFLLQTFRLLLESDDKLLLESGDDILLESGNGVGSGTYGDIELGRKVTIKDGAVTVFTGFVEDFDYSYDTDNRSEATLTVRDSLATLGATNFTDWRTTEAQLTGARVSAILDRPEIGFPSGASARTIATGTQPLNSSLIPLGTNALQELQRVNRAEYGRLFVDAAGKLVFQDRYAVFGLTSSATFSDDGVNLPISDIQIRFGTELLHFSVSVNRQPNSYTVEDDENGDPIYVNDADQVTERIARNEALIAGYPSLGVRNLAIPNLPYQSDDHAYGLAELLLERYASFAAVISGLTVPLGRLSSSDRATVCGLDIGDVITVAWVPYGATGQVTQTLAIEGVTFTARESKNGEDVTTNAFVSFLLSDASDPDYFQVGTDAVDGPKFVAP